MTEVTQVSGWLGSPWPGLAWLTYSTPTALRYSYGTVGR